MSYCCKRTNIWNWHSNIQISYESFSNLPELGALRREIFAWIYFHESFFKYFADLISQIGYRWIFREDLFSRILVLSMFYIFWIFRDLFSARMLVTKLLLKFFDISNGFIWIQILYWMSRRSKGADIIKRFSFFFLFCLYLYCLISCKIFLIWSLKLSTT